LFIDIVADGSSSSLVSRLWGMYSQPTCFVVVCCDHLHKSGMSLLQPQFSEDFSEKWIGKRKGCVMEFAGTHRPAVLKTL
jgi:hypothetical protein